MAKYKVILYYSDGEEEEQDEIFDTASAAASFGSEMCACVAEGAETSSMSNPGDYPEADALSADYEVIEIDE